MFYERIHKLWPINGSEDDKLPFMKRKIGERKKNGDFSEQKHEIYNRFFVINPNL